MTSHFDEKSGRVECKTPWGSWYQTVGEIFVLVDVPKGTRAKDLNIKISPSELHVSRNGVKIFGGKLSRLIKADESTWTLEEQEKIHILLEKASGPKSEEIWRSLLVDEFKADPLTLLEMNKKLDLEKFQLENPGFDFSNATLDKNYENLAEFVDSD